MPFYRNNSSKALSLQTVKTTPVSNRFCQENLTKMPKKVFNRDTYLTPSFMGLNKIGTGLAALAAAAMAPGAAAQEAPEQAASTETPAEAERDAIVQVTREQCRALADVDREEMVACYTQLRAQREAEIAALDQQEQQLDRENATLVAETDAEQQANVERRTTVNGLRRVVALKEERDPGRQ